ncbi:MAG: rRNA maturation RNase YbeY [Pseudomonadota bacterium]
MTISISIAVDAACGAGEEVPEPARLRAWLRAALRHQGRQRAAICVRIVGEAEGRELNTRYRLRDPARARATNVLSFPADLPAWVDDPLLGDLVICAPVVAREAAEQGKPAAAHWAHLVVHGALHLLGHDHQDDTAAERMEALETEILGALGFPPPYRPAPEPTGIAS